MPASLIVSFGVGNPHDLIAVKNDKQPPTASVRMAPEDPQESYTTVRLRVAQFDSGQKVYQASGDVPISADGGIEKMSPVASVGN